MISLKQYLFESIICESTAKFDRGASSISELKEDKPEFFSLYDENAITDLLNDIESNYKGVKIELKYIYTTGNKNYIKIPYAYKDAIISVLSSEKYKASDFTYNAVGNKITVKVKGKELFETGSGSLKTVNTRDQEVATCQIWNDFITVDTNKNLKNYTRDDVNNIMKDNMESSVKFNDEWAYSFTKQVYAIKNYLNVIGITNIVDYKAERYGGDAKIKDWVVSKHYDKLISKYVKVISGKKDNYDPSDIIIYNTKYADDIISVLDKLASYDDVLQAKKEFTDIFYLDRESKLRYKLIGISLKKISSGEGKYEIYNINQTNRINVTDFDFYENSCKIVCFGEFNFGNVDTSDDDNKIDKAKLSENQISLTFRRFGYNNSKENLGMDVKLCNEKGTDRSPSLGKVPVRDWKATITSDISSLEEGKAKIKKYFESTDKEKIVKDLEFLALEAIKCGPNCFPFILIH